MVTHLPSIAMADSTVAKTGQTTSYKAGDDGALEKGVSWPSPRFTDNGDGTVTDNLTNLIWTQDASCHSTITWETALTTARELADGECDLSDSSSAGDWRVPNLRELESLLHYGVWSPAISDTDGDNRHSDNDPFSDLKSEDYWSSTSNTGSPNQAFTVSFEQGVIPVRSKTSVYYVLFVRDSTTSSAEAPLYRTGQSTCYDVSGNSITCSDTGQDGDLQKGLVWPSPRFTDNGNGTVSDKVTGLLWMKNAGCWALNNWSGAISKANGLESGDCGLSDGSEAGDWRLPNRRELHSLIDYEYNSPALGDTFGTEQWSAGNPFTNLQATSGYWTSTTYTPATYNGWFVNINQGWVGNENKTGIAYGWAVRDTLQARLTVEIAGDGEGKVTSNPAGISCPGSCSAEFEKSETVTLTASPTNRSRLSSWSIGSCDTSKECTVELSSSTTVTATFTKITGNSVSSWMILLTK